MLIGNRQIFNYLNVKVAVGDGTLGLKDNGPYDAIVVTAACYKIPAALKSQLKNGGRLVIPLGDKGSQALMKIVRRGEEYRDEDM